MCINKNERNDLILALIEFILNSMDDDTEIYLKAKRLLTLELEKNEKTFRRQNE